MNTFEQQSITNQEDKDIFDRMRSGETIRLDDAQYSKVQAVVNRTIKLNAKLNTSEDVEQIRKHLGEIIGTEIDTSTIVFAPFYTNFRSVYHNRQKCIYQSRLFLP